jgi:hypothetical protein
MPPKRQPLKGLTKDLMLGSIDKQEREQLAKQGGVASPTPVAPDPDTSPSQDAIETFLKAVNATNVKKVVYCFPERWLPTQHKFEALRGEQCTALWKYMSHQLASVRVEAEKSLKMRLKKEREAKARAAGERPYADLAYDDALAVLWDGEKRLMQPSDWVKGGGSKNDAVWDEVRRREKLLREPMEVRESHREGAGKAPDRLPPTEAPRPRGGPRNLNVPAFRTRSLASDAHDKNMWKVGSEQDMTAIRCVDAAIPADVQIQIGVLFIMTVWTPLFSEWLKMNGIMLTLARILTVGGVEVSQAMVLAAQCAEGARDDTCPATPLKQLFDAKYGLAERDGEGKFTLGGSVLRKIVKLDPTPQKQLKPNVPKVVGVCVQKAILAGAINFGTDDVSCFACGYGKQFLADLLFRNGRNVDFAASIGLPLERFPINGTVAQYAAHGIEIQYDIQFESSAEIWTVIDGSLDDFMKARRDHYAFAKAEHELGRDVETTFNFYSVFAAGPRLETVVRGGVATCELLDKIREFDQAAASDLCVAAKAAAGEIFPNRDLREFTAPQSVFVFFCPETQKKNYTIWCGRDFDIYYYKNGVLVRVVKSDFLMRRIQALMRSRAPAASVGATAAPSVVTLGVQEASAVPPTPRAPGVPPAGQPQLDAEPTTSSITAGVAKMEVSPPPKAAPDVEEALRADDPDASTELPLANAAAAAATGVASDEQAPGGAPAAARPVVPTTLGPWIPTRGEAPPGTVDPYLSPPPLDESPIAPPTYNPTVARSLLERLDAAADLQVPRGDALDELLKDAADFDVDGDKAMAYEEKKDEEPPDTGRTADVPSRSSRKDRPAPSPPRRDRRAAQALSDAAGRAVKGQFEPSPAKGTSAHN